MTSLRVVMLAVAAAASLLLSACVEFSAFETDLDDDECDHNARNLERLAELTPPAGALRFAVMTDSHQAFAELSEVIDAVNQREPVFALHLGDMTDLGLRQEYRWTLEELRRLQPPFLTAIGNHDALSNGKDVYRRMFGAYDYQFAHGDVRFVVVNTNQHEFDGDAPDLDWLSDATTQSPRTRVTIVAGHQSPSDSSRYEQTLAANHVDAVISGHVHRTELSMLVGVPSIAIGSVKERRWALVTIEDGRIAVEDCVSSTCTPRSP